MAAVILSVKNGCFGYAKQNNILENINFDAQKGDVIAILGPNGVGKTTLLKCIMGFLKWRSGESIIGGKNIKNLSPKQLWNIVSYVPQAKQSTSSLTVREMILLGKSGSLNFFETPSSKDVADAFEVMKRLNIESIAEKQCNEISGGQLQMVLIARALVSNPQILILDEPESNLDFKNQIIVLDTISQLAQSGVCCIFNTHYPAHALRRANKSLLISKHGGVLFGNTAEVVTEKNIEAAFGVKTVIGTVETEKNALHDIVPVEISSENTAKLKISEFGNKLAVMSVTVKNDASVDEVNKCIHEYGKYIVGRMGMPYKKYDIRVINLTLDGPQSKLKGMELKLSSMKGINVKTIYEDEQ